MTGLNTGGIRILWALFRNSYFGILCVLLAVFTIVYLLLAGMSLYQQGVESKFAEKQPHIVISSIQDYWPESDVRNLQAQLSNSLDHLDAMSPFVQGKETLSLKAGIVLPGEAEPSQYSKYSSLALTVIGVDKSEPTIFNFLADQSYVSGDYRIRLTPLEQIYAWVYKPLSVVPNRVLDASFYPPISQSVVMAVPIGAQMLKLPVFQTYADYSELPILYASMDMARTMLGLKNDVASGLYINVDDTKVIDVVMNQLEAALAGRDDLRVTSWLEGRMEQEAILTTLKHSVLIVCFMVIALGVLQVLLSQYRSIVMKSFQLQVLYAMGLRPVAYLAMGLVSVFVIALLLAFTIGEQIAQSIAPLLGYIFEPVLLSGYVHYAWGIFIVFSIVGAVNIHFAVEQGRRV